MAPTRRSKVRSKLPPRPYPDDESCRFEAFLVALENSHDKPDEEFDRRERELLEAWGVASIDESEGRPPQGRGAYR